MTDYKFDEDKLLKELKEYVDSTYDQHYAKGDKIQVTEFIMSHLETPDFLRGNMLKYAARYGMKEGYNRKDILKALHYGLLLLCYHDRRYQQTVDFSNTPLMASCQPQTLSQNVYVDMGGGRIGQEQNGKVVFIGFGELNENGTLKQGTYRYSSEGR